MDPENRLISYGSLETNGYDIDGRRAWSSSASGITYFLYGGDSEICELSSTGTVEATNTVVGRSQISRNSNGASTFYTFDPSGSTSQRLSNSGAINGNSIADAFGLVYGSSSSDPYSGFSARMQGFSDAATGLTLLGHRYYDSSTGRFINRDPMGYDGGNNLYGYCVNDRTALSDPAGYSPCSDLVDNMVRMSNIVYNRYHELLEDRNNEWGYRFCPGGKAPDGYSYAGHQQAMANAQQGLQNLIQAFIAKGCGDLSFRIPKFAFQNAMLAVPTQPRVPGDTMPCRRYPNPPGSYFGPASSGNANAQCETAEPGLEVVP